MTGSNCSQVAPDLSEQPGEFLDTSLEQLERRLDRRRRRHVDPSLSERLNGELPAAASQEVQIPRGVTGFEHLPGKRYCRGNSGRILVNIKGAIKVRNPESFELQFGIDGKVGSKIGIQQFAVDFLETCKSKWLPSFLGGVC